MNQYDNLGRGDMRNLAVCFVLTLVICSEALAQIPATPLNISLYQRRETVEKLLNANNRKLFVRAGEDGMQSSLGVTNVEWLGIAYDSLIVWLSPETSRVVSILLVRKCDSDQVPLVVAELTDAISRVQGEPNVFDETVARWERAGNTAVSIGPYENEKAVWVRLDLPAMFTRLSDTRPIWPLGLTAQNERDDVREVMTDSCRRAKETDNNSFESVGCSCYGLKARKTSVLLDDEGRPIGIEMTLPTSDRAEVLRRIESVFGPPTVVLDGTPQWMADVAIAISVADGEGGIVASFTIAAMEALQYMEK